MLSTNVKICSDLNSILVELPSFSENEPNNLRTTPYYVCKVIPPKCSPIIGLVNLINYQDFHSKIIPHEHVYNNKINDYVQKFIISNILNNPILLFYKHFSEFQHFLNQLVHSLDQINVQCINEITYEIFSVNSYETVKILQNYLEKIPKFYIADGHHRVYALSKIRTQSMTNFSQRYLSFIVQEDDLKLGSFNRFIKIVNLNIEYFIQQLKQKYIIEKVSKEKLNCETNIYMYINDSWYKLNLKKQFFYNKFTKLPSVHIEKFVISLLTSISPFKSEILYSPSTEKIDDILQFYRENQCQVAISIPKISHHDLFIITENAHRLPPHSTYFTPKIPNDLFIQKINFSPL